MSDKGLPATFENPGLPPHIHRAADDDPRAAKRAERQVAALFTLSILGTLGFIVSYFAVPNDTTVFIPFIGKTILLNILLGVTLAVSLLGIGFGAVHWAKTLMSDEEVIEERHPIASSDECTVSVISLALKMCGTSMRSAAVCSTMAVRPSASRKVQIGSSPGGNRKSGKLQ